MNKQFIDYIKQTLYAEPKTIDSLLEKFKDDSGKPKGFKESDFILNDTLKIVGYIESIEKEEYDEDDEDELIETHKNILFIDILPKTAPDKPSFYIDAIATSKLITRSYILKKEHVYFLFYGLKKNDYRLFELNIKNAIALRKSNNNKSNQAADKSANSNKADNNEIAGNKVANNKVVKINNDKLVSLMIGTRLNMLTKIFKDVNLINNDSVARSEMTAIIDDLWSKLGLGADSRWPFIILTYILLKNDEIPFYTTDIGTEDEYTYSLREYEELRDKAYNFDTMNGNLDEIRRVESKFHNEGERLIDAFKNIQQYKLYEGNRSYNEHYKNIVKFQQRKLNEIIDNLKQDKIKQNGIMIVDNIYNRIFKKVGRDVDICKITFEVEQKYNNRIADNIVAKKGQIYTHKMMKDLIIEVFNKNIKHDSICYDPTCGTGGFAESFWEFCDKRKYKETLIYCNEIDNDCSNIAWIHGMCSNQDVRAFNLDCFSNEIKSCLIPLNSIDFILMNPPYGMSKGSNKGAFPTDFDWSENQYLDMKKLKLTELTFCRYNVESFCKPGGWYAWVIPVSCVSENKQNTTDKQAIIEKSEVWYVIKMREDIFTPQAGKACCIVIGRFLGNYDYKRKCKHVRTQKEINTWKTKCIDFTDDGGEIKKKKGYVEYSQEDIKKLWYERILDSKCLDGIYKDDNKNIIESVLNNFTSADGKEIETSAYYVERNLKATDNWIYTKREQQDVSTFKNTFISNIENRRHERVSANIKATDWSKFDKPENINCEWRDTKLTDLFDILGRGKSATNECIDKASADNVDKGLYPLISAKTVNNGIAGYTNKFEYGNDNELLLTISIDGEGAGTAFVQKGKFAAVNAVQILKPKAKYNFDEDDLVKIAFMMTQKLTKIYNWSNKLNATRLQNESVNLPYNKLSNTIDIKITTAFDVEGCEVCRDINVNEIFELVKCGSRTLKNVKPGDIPLIGRSEHNNGIIGYCDEYDLDGNYITVPSDSSACCFVQKGKIALGVKVYALALKPEYQYLEDCLSALAFAMTIEFKHKYNWNYAITSTRLMNEVIPQIPYCQNPKKPDEMIIDVSGLKYIYI